MGWKGTIRSAGTEANIAERDEKIRQNELKEQHKKYDAMSVLEQAAYDVDVYENYIDVIQSMHKECGTKINWRSIQTSPKPEEPIKAREHEQKALLEVDNYKPNLIDRLLNRVEKKKAVLLKVVEDAITLDQKAHEYQLPAWNREVETWQENVDLAKALLNAEEKAKLETIEALQPFIEMSNLGSEFSVSTKANGLLEVTIKVNGATIIPSKLKGLLKSGKLSVKKLPNTKYNEIYRNYVCSMALRAGNELFAILPDKLIIVTAIDCVLNAETEVLENSTILSIAMSRKLMAKLKLKTLEPSTVISDFVHNMSFKKTKGFEEVESIDLESLDLKA
jgi:hypothetical protein